MSEATLQTLAYDLGIEKMVREMTEAEKAQLRYIQIMRSSTEWQTDMGRTLITPANALRVMRQQFIQLGRAIGKVFIPIIMSAMPYVIAITQLLTALAQKLANFLGYEIADIDYSGLGDISAGITDIGTSADKTAEKLNTMLAPFDDLNVVQNQSKNASSGLGGIGGDLGVELPEYDALANLNEKFAEGVEKAKKNLEKLVPVVLTIGGALALWKISSSVLDTISSILKASDVLSKITPMDATKWSKILGGGLSIAIGAVLATIGIGLGWKAIKQALENNGWDKSSLSNYGIATATTIVGGVLIGLGVALVAGLPILLSMLVGGVVALVVAGIALLISTIVIYWEDIKTFFSNLWETIKVGASDLWESVKEIFSQVGTWFDENVIQPVMTVFSPIIEWFGKLFNSIWQTVSDVWYNIVGIITGVAEIIKVAWGIMASWFNDNVIQPVSTFFSNMWEGLKNGAKQAWEGVKSIFSKVADFFGNIFSKAWERVKNVFSIGGKIFDGIKDGILNAFTTIVNAIIKGINKVVATPFNGINKALTKIKNIDILGIQPFKDKIKTINVPQIPLFEQGGYPTSGELFFANENGMPEMVGRIGNQTAVANNDQITTSITNALMSALNQYDFGGGKSPTTIYIGNKKVYEGYGDYVADENDRYGTNMIKI